MVKLMIIFILLNNNINNGNSNELLKTKSYHLPLDYIILNPGDHHRRKEVTYRWKQIMGHHALKLLNRTNRLAAITEIKIGYYAFQVEIQIRNTTQRIFSIVQIEVFDKINQKPKSNAGGDRLVYLPARSVRLRGSGSSDDKAIVRYHWLAERNNPVGLEIIGDSDNESDLLLRKLSPGKYVYKLTVHDSAGLRDVNKMILTIKEDRHIGNIVQIHFMANLRNFTYLNLKNFKSQVSLILSKSIINTKFTIDILSLRQDPTNGLALLEFYVAKGFKGHMIPAFTLIKILRPVIFDNINIFIYPVVQITAPDCSKACFIHGYCEYEDNKCVCDIFWISNLWKDWVNDHNSKDCEWNIFYTSIGGLVIVLVIFVSCRLFYQLLWRIPSCGPLSSNKMS